MLLVDVAPGTSCWLWRGRINSDGYGVFYFEGKPTGAHRASWLIHRGPIPAGLQIDHLCRTRSCVNPNHLDTVTPRENTIRTQPYRYGEVAGDRLRRFCKNGHEMAGKNLGQRSDGTRKCLACMRGYQRAYLERKAARA